MKVELPVQEREFGSPQEAVEYLARQLSLAVECNTNLMIALMSVLRAVVAEVGLDASRIVEAAFGKQESMSAAARALSGLLDAMPSSAAECGDTPRATIAALLEAVAARGAPALRVVRPDDGPADEDDTR